MCLRFLQERIVFTEGLLTCTIVCSAFTAFPLGHNTWWGRRRKSQGACVRLLMWLGVGKYLESKHFDTSKNYRWGKHVFFFLFVFTNVNVSVFQCTMPDLYSTARHSNYLSRFFFFLKITHWKSPCFSESGLFWCSSPTYTHSLCSKAVQFISRDRFRPQTTNIFVLLLHLVGFVEGRCQRWMLNMSSAICLIYLAAEYSWALILVSAFSEACREPATAPAVIKQGWPFPHSGDTPSFFLRLPKHYS